MRFALVFCCVLMGCGGLQNEPLTRGDIEGRLLNADADALVGIVGQPQFTTHPGADGAFHIDDAPAGELELFLVMNSTRALRLQATVNGGDVLRLGALEGGAAAHLTVEYEGPEFLRLYDVNIFLKDMPLPVAHTQEGVHWVVPAGCYLAHGEARGLRAVEQQECLGEGESRFIELHPLPPDGTEGNEGCVVGDCDFGATCQMDGSCTL